MVVKNVSRIGNSRAPEASLRAATRSPAPNSQSPAPAPDSRPTTKGAQRRRGVTLLLCLFVIGVTSVMLLGILETSMLEMTAARNTGDYERAVYLAGAGIHHALAELEQDPNWTGPIPPTEFPAGSGNTYEVTTSPGSGNTIIVTSTGTAGTLTRTLEATVQLGE